MTLILVSHNLTRSSKGPMYGDERMDCVLTIWSSRSICVSSKPMRIHEPVSRHAIVSNTTPDQSPCILSSVRSSENSLLAYSETSSMMARCLGSSSCSARVTEKEASALTGKPRSWLMRVQCRSRRPGLRRATMSGRLSWKATIFSLSTTHTCWGAPFSVLAAFMTPRYQVSMRVVTLSGSSAVKGPSNHSGLLRLNSAHIFHMLP
mmetsp:Transcript_30416/g.76133  ORF Transcript_30416/g.76133 Transcript_30416/m.76133 type:complete len:206 (+) Transcript_30416:1390-2007(+)